jgi:hypothetical protein
MDPSRDEEKRRRVEAAVERLIRRDGLTPDRARTLSEGIYGLYRNLVAQNPSTIKIGIMTSGYIAQSAPLRYGPQMDPAPKFQRMSPMRESSRPI